MEKDHGKNSCRNWKKNRFMRGKEILPIHWRPQSSIEEIIENYAKGPFEGRKVAAGAKLLRSMVINGDMIWLSVAGAGPAGGMGGYITDFIKAGFVDAICSTGAQVYHDAHFAFSLPVVQGPSQTDDAALDEKGVTRIYDIYIMQEETLLAQDKIFQDFARDLPEKRRSTADLSKEWGEFILKNAPNPERSFIAAAAQYSVPVFWDSESNHSLGMNLAALDKEGISRDPSPSLSLRQGAAIIFSNPQYGYFEWGGGGPKNWVQTLPPQISQIFGIEFKGAEKGIQITTAPEHDGGLSGCTFSEAKTWGKYGKEVPEECLIQIRQEYSIVAPLIIGYVLETCMPRTPKRLFDRIPEFMKKIESSKK